MGCNAKTTRRVVLGLTAAVAALGPLGANAGAAPLNGPFGPFDRCPADDAVMLAAAAGQDACVAADSPSGTFTIGSTTTTTGRTNLQIGVGGNAVVPGTNGSLVAAPADVPGGLLGLMCPSTIPIVSGLCQQATSNDLNRVTATVEGAGAPSNVNIGGGLVTGVRIITLPVKLHLQNPLLGSNCYIGSDSDPIVLQPQTTDLSNAHITFQNIDLDGTPNARGVLDVITVAGATQGDDSFAVPAASGCGPLGLASAAVNRKQGLPSPAGSNSVLLDDATSSVLTWSGISPAPTAAQFAQALHDAGLS
jgi:hypothetical protein